MNVQQQFNDACKNGNLEEAKKLLQNNPTIDVSAYDEYAFKLACTNGHLQVAQWFCSFNPFTYCIKTNNNKLISWNVNNNKEETVLSLLYCFTNKGYENKLNAELVMDVGVHLL